MPSPAGSMGTSLMTTVRVISNTYVYGTATATGTPSTVAGSNTN